MWVNPQLLLGGFEMTCKCVGTFMSQVHVTSGAELGLMRFQRLHVETDCEQATKLQVSIPITLVCFCCTFYVFHYFCFSRHRNSNVILLPKKYKVSPKLLRLKPSFAPTWMHLSNYTVSWKRSLRNLRKVCQLTLLAWLFLKVRQW